MSNVAAVGSRQFLSQADAVVRANNTVSREDAAKVQAAAEKFESFFIAQMLRQMRQATREMAGEDSVFNSRSSENMLDMADLALADSLASHRAFGIADAIVRQLLPAAPQIVKEFSAPVASIE